MKLDDGFAGRVDVAARGAVVSLLDHPGDHPAPSGPAAQQAIIAVVRQLEADGVLSLKEAAGEQYVV